MLQSRQKSNFLQIEQDLQIHNLGEILTSLICHNIYFYMKIKKNLLMFDLVIMQYEKRIFSTKNIKCDVSNFSEFHQHYEYASHILFYQSWIFADFVA